MRSMWHGSTVFSNWLERLGLNKLHLCIHSVSTLLGVVCRDALLHTTVVMCGYLRYCHLPISFDQSGTSPLTSLHYNNTFLPTELLPTGCFFVFHTILFKPFFVHGNPKRSAISEILNPPCLAPAVIPQTKSLKSYFFPILTFGLKNSWTP